MGTEGVSLQACAHRHLFVRTCVSASVVNFSRKGGFFQRTGPSHLEDLTARSAVVGHMSSRLPLRHRTVFSQTFKPGSGFSIDHFILIFKFLMEAMLLQFSSPASPGWTWKDPSVTLHLHSDSFQKTQMLVS